MRNLKVIGLLAVAVVVTAALPGVASAVVFTSPLGSGPYTGEEHFKSKGHVQVDNPIAKIECEYTQITDVDGHAWYRWFWVHRTATKPVFSNCTNSWHVTVVSAGEEEVEHTSGYDGAVYSTGMTFEATRFGVTCRYATNNTKIATLTGGSPAIEHLSGNIPFHSGSGLCGSSPTAWTGTLEIKSPSSLFVDAE